MRSLIVVGSGIAGLFTALSAREAGVRDVLIDFPQPRPEWRRRQLFTVRCRPERRFAHGVEATRLDCQVPS